MKRPRRIPALVMLLMPLALIATAQPRKTGFADIDGRKVYFEMQGQGAAIVLIHGFSLDSRMWDPQFDALARHHQVLRYDASGYGRSSVPDSPISGVDELAALLRALGISRAALLGMSMGGNVAINFTLKHPEVVAALITVGSTLDGYIMQKSTRLRFRRVLAAVNDSGLAKAKEIWLNDLLLTPVTRIAAIKAKIRQIVLEWPGAQFLRSTFADFLPLRPPAIRRLEGIRIPTLVLNGEHDDPSMLAIGDTIASRVPWAKRVIVPRSGHLVNLERPDEFNELVEDFIADLTR